MDYTNPLIEVPERIYQDAIAQWDKEKCSFTLSNDFYQPWILTTNANHTTTKDQKLSRTEGTSGHLCRNTDNSTGAGTNRQHAFMPIFYKESCTHF